MTYLEVYSDYSDYSSPYYPMEYSGTSLSIDDLLSSAWLWDPPSELPTMYVKRPTPSVIAPHIETRSCKQFFGHKFTLGGSKK